MWNSSAFQGLWTVFKGFSRQTRKVFSEENVCPPPPPPPTSLNRHTVKIDCIYNKHKVTIYLYVSLVKIHPVLNDRVLTSHFLKSKPLCNLENGIKVTKNLTSSCFCLNNIAVQVWSESSIHSADSEQTSHYPTIWALLRPWKWDQGHQNKISYFPCLNNLAVQV